MDYQILVNKEHKLDRDYYEKVVKPSVVAVDSFKDNYIVYEAFGIEDKTTYLEKLTSEKFIELRNYAIENNIFLGITSGFLTFTQQEVKYNYFLNKRGIEFTEKSICLPGYSEHNTGLALDCDIFKDFRWGGIALDKEGNTNQETDWLHQNLHKFGFILRYPKNKESITQMKFEPWHIRYVGEELAKIIYENSLTLEEYYLQKNKFRGE